MIKKITEEKVVNVERHVAACDICELEQIEATALVVLRPALITNNANLFMDEGSDNQSMMICGDCLANNSKAVKLILDSKTFPHLRETYKKNQERYAEMSLKLVTGSSSTSYSYSIPGSVQVTP